MTIREAVLSDLEQLVDLVLIAMVRDPAWSYRFRYHAEFRDDHRKYTEMIWRNFVNDDYKDWIVYIKEKIADGKPTILAFSVWNFSYANKRKYGTEYATKSRKTVSIIIVSTPPSSPPSIRL
ncbi:putative gnat family protein [Ilyonectria robusta]